MQRIFPSTRSRDPRDFSGIFLLAGDNIKKPNFLWIFLLPCGYNTKLRRLGGIFS
jgi:hypothetical protein